MNEEIKKDLEIILKATLNVVPEAVCAYLFGSRAYGIPHNDSDLDVLIVAPDGFQNGRNARIEIVTSLDNKIKRSIDLIIKTESKFNARKSLPTIEKLVAQNGIKFYERNY